jgi:hypothetical protein
VPAQDRGGQAAQAARGYFWGHAEEQREDAQYAQDFERIIRRELELQGYRQEEPPKGFDYLTNPGGPPPEESAEQEEAPEPHHSEAYSIAENVERLERFYENSLKKKFERRELFPHKACRRKTPKLYITQKNNALSKAGRPSNDQEHLFRVMTKETTPQEIYPTIPGFAVVKDNLSRNILAYLGDYRPFIEKTKEKIEQEAQAGGPELAVDGASNSPSALG